MQSAKDTLNLWIIFICNCIVLNASNLGFVRGKFIDGALPSTFAFSPYISLIVVAIKSYLLFNIIRLIAYFCVFFVLHAASFSCTLVFLRVCVCTLRIIINCACVRASALIQRARTFMVNTYWSQALHGTRARARRAPLTFVALAITR